MIITCEECSTRFNLDESLLRPEGSKVRCSRCKHVFTAFPETSEVPAPDFEPEPESAPEPDPESESFEFAPPEEETEAPYDDDIGAIPSIEEPEETEEPEDAPDFDVSFDEDDDDYGIEVSPETEFQPDTETESDDLDFGEQDIDFNDIAFDEPEPESRDSISGDADETPKESDDMDLSFEESEINFDEDDFAFEDGEPDDELDDDFDLEETGDDLDGPEEISFDAAPLEMETSDEAADEEIQTAPDLDVPSLEMENSQEDDKDPDPGTEAFDEPEFDEPEDLDFDSDDFDMDDSGFQETEFEESDSPSDEPDPETADIEISFDDEDDIAALTDIPLEMDAAEASDASDTDVTALDDGELEFEESDIEFEDSQMPAGMVDEEDREALDDIDFEDLSPEEDGSAPAVESPAEDFEDSPDDDLEEVPDLELSFDEHEDADLVFEEDFETDDLPGLEMASLEEEPDLSDEELPDLAADVELADTDLTFDETGNEPPAFEEDNADFQASLDAELETDKFAGYDDVLNQGVEPESGQPDFDSELGDGPDAPQAPAAASAADAPAQEPEAPAQGMRAPESPLIDPLPDEDVRKKRARKKKSAIGAPVKVLFLLFVLVVAAYVASLQFGYTIPFLSDLKIPYLTEMIQPEPAPKPVLKPVPNEVSIKGRFLTNATAGEIFIVTGKVDNPSQVAYSHIRVKGTLITKENPKAMTQIIYCGNIIGEEELKSGNISDIQQKLTVKEGMQNANVNIGPGKAVRFMLVFSNLPENLTNFTVEVLDFKNSTMN